MVVIVLGKTHYHVYVVGIGNKSTPCLCLYTVNPIGSDSLSI